MTFHQNAIASGMQAKILEDSRWGPFLVNMRQSLLRGDYQPRELVDAIFQMPRNRPVITLEDSYAFALVWDQIFSGEVGLHHVPRVGQCGCDVDIVNNQRTLAQLRSPYAATFRPERGAGANGDGCMSWTRPVEFLVTSISENDEEIGTMLTCDPHSVPLEVGTTSPSRTFAHLLTGGVARWPYGHDSIMVLLPVHMFTQTQSASPPASVSEPAPPRAR